MLCWCSVIPWGWSRQIETCRSYDKLSVKYIILTLENLLVLNFESTFYWIRVPVGLKNPSWMQWKWKGIWDYRESNPGSSFSSQPPHWFLTPWSLYVFMYKKLFLIFLFIGWLTDGLNFHKHGRNTLTCSSRDDKAIYVCPHSPYECRCASGGTAPQVTLDNKI